MIRLGMVSLPRRLSKRDKYCRNGGMAFAHHQASACLGVHDGDHGPFRWSLEMAGLQGKSRRGRGPCPLGAAIDSSALAAARSTAPQRGHRLSPRSRRASRGGCRPEGPRSRSWPPMWFPRSCPFAGKRFGDRDSHPLGAAMDSSAFSLPQEVLPQRGHGLRPRSLVGLPGVHEGDHGPLPRSLEMAVLQEKSRRVRGSVPFGGSDGLVLLNQP